MCVHSGLRELGGGSEGKGGVGRQRMKANAEQSQLKTTAAGEPDRAKREGRGLYWNKNKAANTGEIGELKTKLSIKEQEGRWTLISLHLDCCSLQKANMRKVRGKNKLRVAENERRTTCCISYIMSETKSKTLYKKKMGNKKCFSLTSCEQLSDQLQATLPTKLQLFQQVII